MRRWLYKIPLRLRSIFRRSQVETELDEELRFHLDYRIQQEIAAGRTPQEARSIALRSMEGLEQRKEECRDTRRMNLIDNLIRDLRYAIRTLSRSPGFTLAALLALALGIGANTAVFSVINSVLLRPLLFTESDRLVMLFNSRPGVGVLRGGGSIADYLDWKARSHSFQTIDIFKINRFTLAGDGEAEQIVTMNVTATFFETLKARPLFGRTFASDEDQPGRTPTIVLSEHLWHRRYASRPDIVGKQIMLNGQPYTVIGVMPGDAEFGPRGVEAWPILTINPPIRRGQFFYRGVARLKPGVTVAQAAAEMEAIAHEVERSHPQGHKNLSYPVIPMHEVIVGNIRPLLWVLGGAVLLVLLIAVSNVANLMLARATTRQRETAIRLSIGAGRGQLIRQLMTESLVLSLLGGALGIALAIGGVAALQSLGPRDMPRLNEITVDTGALIFTLLVSVVSAMLFGLIPAFSASRVALNESLKQGGRTGESHGQGRIRSILVVAQMTLSVLLLIGAGLLIRSFSLLESVNPGFSAPASRVLTMNLLLTGQRYADSRAVTTHWDQLLDRVRSLPAVEAASVAITIPPDRLDFTDDYQIEGKPLPPGEQNQAVPVPVVSSDYFKTLGVPVLRGRGFDGRDRADSPQVTVISYAMAQRHFKDENPVGQRLKYGDRSMEIVGVVGDVKYRGLERADEPAFYMATAQMPPKRVWLLVRTQGNADVLTAAVRQEIRALDPEVPIDRVSTMSEALAQSLSLPRFRSLLMTVFAAVALLLAAIGIYGVIAYSVAQRTQEIGVRMALGANRSKVLNLIVGQGSRLAVIGIVLGLAASFALSSVLQKMLYGITTSDTITFASAALVLGAVAILASLIPALRAARIDPVIALRQE